MTCENGLSYLKVALKQCRRDRHVKTQTNKQTNKVYQFKKATIQTSQQDDR